MTISRLPSALNTRGRKKKATTEYPLSWGRLDMYLGKLQKKFLLSMAGPLRGGGGGRAIKDFFLFVF